MLYSGLREASADTDKRCYTLAGIGKRLFVRPLFTNSTRHYLPLVPPEIWGETGDYTMIESDKYISNVNQPGAFSAVLHNVLGIVRRLIGFFTLTEEDRLMAGIRVGGEGRDG